MDDRCIEIRITVREPGSWFCGEGFGFSFIHLYSFVSVGRNQEFVFLHVEFEVHLRYLSGAVEFYKIFLYMGLELNEIIWG